MKRPAHPRAYRRPRTLRDHPYRSCIVWRFGNMGRHEETVGSRTWLRKSVAGDDFRSQPQAVASTGTELATYGAPRPFVEPNDCRIKPSGCPTLPLPAAGTTEARRPGRHDCRLESVLCLDAPPRSPAATASPNQRTRTVRLIIGISLLLLGAGCLSCRLDGLAIDPPTALPDVDWVRTVHGWEQRNTWSLNEVSAVGLHPLVVATSQVMLSVLALASCTVDPATRRPNDAKPA
jgi:hypothetical protein